MARKKPKQYMLDRLNKRLEHKLRTAEEVPNFELEKPCLYATGTKNKYGYVLMDAKPLGFVSPACAHVVSWMIANGVSHVNDIPRDPRSVTGRHEIHHLCGEKAKTKQERYIVRSCIEPSHLVCLTRRQNLKRTARALSKTCMHGHPLEKKNKQGHRRCVTCNRASSNAIYIKQRQEQGKSYTPASLRTKMVNTCGHPDRPHIAHNKCLTCYCKDYYETQRAKRKTQEVSA